MYKILKWDEFREICKADAINWHNSGYTADEITEADILIEYPENYFSDEYTDTDELSSCFSPSEFARQTLEYLKDLEEV